MKSSGLCMNVHVNSRARYLLIAASQLHSTCLEKMDSGTLQSLQRRVTLQSRESHWHWVASVGFSEPFVQVSRWRAGHTNHEICFLSNLSLLRVMHAYPAFANACIYCTILVPFIIGSTESLY